MSLTGVTFANQKITPSDDGRLYGSILSDGILTGCAVTFAAATLSIAAGSMLIGTRELRTSGETLSITGATSGYARVIVDIDLTRATKTSFEQAQLQIQYAASQDAFPALVQQDINAAGTHYQAAFCVVSLGTAGITAIVSTLETALIAPGRVTPESIGALPLAGGTVTGKMQNTYASGEGLEITHANAGTDCGLSIKKKSDSNGGEILVGVGRSGYAGIYSKTLGKWIINTDGTKLYLDALLYRHIYVGTSETPPTTWQPGDIYLQYEA